MEKIEDFIRKNREDLDRYEPSQEVWKEIKKGTRNRKLISARWISAAAMILVVFTTAALFYVAENHKNTASPSRNREAMMLKTNPQLKETEIYYNYLVNDLYAEAAPLLTNHPDAKKELDYDFSQIDSICTDLKKDLRDNIANQEVIGAMINNYRLKIRILEDMLEVLRQDENKSEKNNNHAL